MRVAKAFQWLDTQGYGPGRRRPSGNRKEPPEAGNFLLFFEEIKSFYAHLVLLKRVFREGAIAFHVSLALRYCDSQLKQMRPLLKKKSVFVCNKHDFCLAPERGWDRACSDPP